MMERPNNRANGLISEEDISTLLQKYSATTVLALLQEVAQFPEVKIDWDALVKKTTTGISNAREYQMLWRHLAYRHGLLQKVDDVAEPLDDDSDLEYELEAFPDVSSEASIEAAACVKVLIASALSRDTILPNSTTVEAPLTINIPNGQSFRTPENSQPTCAIQGTNITVPVSVQKQSLPLVASTEGLDANGAPNGSLPPRKKRKMWSQEEDQELIAAVKKFGEGNWANIVRGDFKGNRNASQLAQRWQILRKKHHDKSNTGANSAGTQISDTNKMVELACNGPTKSNPIASNSAGIALDTTSKNSLPATTAAEASPAVHVQHQSQQGPIPAKSSSVGARPIGSAAKPPVTSRKTPEKPNFSSDSIVRATAVAAGARIGNPSDAVSLLKAAQAKNAVHIRPTGGPIKSSLPGVVSTPLDSHPNVHFISNGLATASHSTHASGPSSTIRAGSLKAVMPKVHLSMPSEQGNAATSNLAFDLPVKHVKTTEDVKVSKSSSVAKEQVQGDASCALGSESREQVQGSHAALPDSQAEVTGQVAAAENPNSSSKVGTAGTNQMDANCNLAKENQHADDPKTIYSPIKEGENESAVEQNCENKSPDDRQKDMPDVVANGCSEKRDGSSKEDAGN